MNLNAETKRRLLRSAEDLAADLAQGGATRSEWRHVIDALYLTPGGPDRLTTASDLINALPESWLRDRSRKTESQLLKVHSTFQRVLRQGHSEAEMRFLLGWTTRILDADQKEQRRQGHGQRPPRQPQPARTPRPPEPHPERSTAPPAPQGPQRERWTRATVSFNAGGGGVLRAMAADRRVAEARQDAAQKLLEALGEETRTKLVKRRRTLQFDVDVEKLGASWHLVGLREARP